MGISKGTLAACAWLVRDTLFAVHPGKAVLFLFILARLSILLLCFIAGVTFGAPFF